MHTVYAIVLEISDITVHNELGVTNSRWHIIHKIWIFAQAVKAKKDPSGDCALIIQSIQHNKTQQ